MNYLSSQQQLAHLVAGAIHAQSVGENTLRNYEQLLSLLEQRDPDTRAELEAAVAERVQELQAK